MLKTIRIAALSALVGLGGLAVVPAAQADGLYFSIGQGHGPAYRHHQRQRHAMRGCSAREAVHKAARFGVRNPRVAGTNRHTVTVRGHKHRRPAAITFARAPNCPVVR